MQVEVSVTTTRTVSVTFTVLSHFINNSEIDTLIHATNIPTLSEAILSKEAAEAAMPEKTWTIVAEV